MAERFELWRSTSTRVRKCLWMSLVLGLLPGCSQKSCKSVGNAKRSELSLRFQILIPPRPQKCPLCYCRVLDRSIANIWHSGIPTDSNHFVPGLTHLFQCLGAPTDSISISISCSSAGLRANARPVFFARLRVCEITVGPELWLQG